MLCGHADWSRLQWSEVSWITWVKWNRYQWNINSILLVRYRSGNCGVSIVRSGEAMEQGLRDCCRSIRIGKILVESDAETHAAKVVYARFPDDISKRQVLLMYPIMSTGNTVVQVRYLTKCGRLAQHCQTSYTKEWEKMRYFCPNRPVTLSVALYSF